MSIEPLDGISTAGVPGTHRKSGDASKAQQFAAMFSAQRAEPQAPEAIDGKLAARPASEHGLPAKKMKVSMVDAELTTNDALPLPAGAQTKPQDGVDHDFSVTEHMGPQASAINSWWQKPALTTLSPTEPDPIKSPVQPQGMSSSAMSTESCVTPIWLSPETSPMPSQHAPSTRSIADQLQPTDNSLALSAFAHQDPLTVPSSALWASAWTAEGAKLRDKDRSTQDLSIVVGQVVQGNPELQSTQLVLPATPVAVADQVKHWLVQDVQHAQLTLEGLGPDKVEVAISLQGQLANVVFQTDNPQARAWLQGSLHILSDLLARDGFVLSNATVASTGHGSASHAQDTPQDGGSRRGRIRQMNLPSAAPTVQRLTKLGLDIYV